MSRLFSITSARASVRDSSRFPLWISDLMRGVFSRDNCGIGCSVYGFSRKGKWLGPRLKSRRKPSPPAGTCAFAVEAHAYASARPRQDTAMPRFGANLNSAFIDKKPPAKKTRNQEYAIHGAVGKAAPSHLPVREPHSS